MNCSCCVSVSIGVIIVDSIRASVVSTNDSARFSSSRVVCIEGDEVSSVVRSRLVLYASVESIADVGARVARNVDVY